MAIKINFDPLHNPEKPTVILARKNGDKLGMLNAQNIIVTDSLNDPSEMSFKVYKYIDGKKTPLWEELNDFKLVWCKEWDTWFEINVEVSETNETVKTVYCKQVGQAELSQIMLYDIEINTETDMEREEYDKNFPTVLYREDHHEASLLHRILEKAPHYSISHVDDTIANLQRTFTFDDKSIYDALQEIAEEINCVFVFNCTSEEDGNIHRTISAYDLESNCKSCGYRGEFVDECPKCGSYVSDEGFGKDTTIFITSDALADDIKLTTSTDSIKNCFKLQAGDNLMTSTIQNCNPNGTDYIWYIPDHTRNDMSLELRQKLSSYDELYSYYQKNYVASLDNSLVSSYNNLSQKYGGYYKEIFKHDFPVINTPIKGYPALMTAYYNTVDLSVFLQSSLMPSVGMDDTNATEQAGLLTAENLSPTAITDISNLSLKLATVNSAVLGMAKVIVDSRYKVEISSSSISENIWSGSFTVTNYSDEEDSATSDTISIVINDDYRTYVYQKMQKALNKKDTEDMSISGLFKETMSLSQFKTELKKYCLNRLTSFHDACQACIDILIEQGIANKETWSGKDPNLYDDLYIPYYNKLKTIEDEMAVRQKDINIVLGAYDKDGYLIQQGVQSDILSHQKNIQEQLNFEKYLGEELWLEFCTFRRESKYSNDNYISDSLDNAELFKRALEFIEEAEKDIYKSAEMQHSISCSLKNLLAIKKFEPLVDSFEVGNWMRVRIDDKIYKLRMVKYEIDFDNDWAMSVEFSDVMNATEGIKFQQSVIKKAISMGSSYESTRRQASQGVKSNDTINDWMNNGFNTANAKIVGGADNQTQTWDEHGMLFRKQDGITDSYEDEQMKIINSTLAVTTDNWKTTKTAVGKIGYIDPESGELKWSYGVNGETLVGNIILGTELGIYNPMGNMKFTEDGLEITDTPKNNIFKVNPNDSEHFFQLSLNNGTSTLEFDENGLAVSNGINTFTVNPNDYEKMVKISNKQMGDVFYADNIGQMHLWKNNLILNNTGMHFRDEDDNYIGKIGINNFRDYPDCHGLVFDINYNTSYMSWGAQDEENGDYVTKLSYHGKNSFRDEGIYFFCDTYYNDNIKVASYNNGNVGLEILDDTHYFQIVDGKRNKPICDFNTNSVVFHKDLDMKGNNILHPSDARLKTNIENTDVNALDTINQIELKQFDWIENDKHEDIGMIAQQLQDILPDLVHEDKGNGKLSIKTDKFIPYLIKANQELYRLVQSLISSQDIAQGQNGLTSFKVPKRKTSDSWENISLEEKNEFVEKLKSEVTTP